MTRTFENTASSSASIHRATSIASKISSQRPCRIALLALFASCWIGSTVTAVAQAAATGAPPAEATAQAAPAAMTPLASQSMLYPGEDFQLQPGDLVSVLVFMQPEYQATVRVGLDGTAQLPFIGSVPLQGLSVHAAQALIAERLRTGQFYRNPDVILRVLDTVNGSVQITGELRAIVPVATERSLKDVLLTAGGLPANASHTVKIVRPGLADPIVVNLGTDLASSTTANVAVHPHDIIQITRASVVYLLGAFNHQTAVPLDQASPLTLLQVTAIGGGIGFEGQFDDLRIIRTVGTDRSVVRVDIKKVRDGKAPDPVLQANDIVFLPPNSLKALVKNLGVGGILGMVSLLIAAHSY